MTKEILMDVTLRDPWGGKVFVRKGKEMPTVMKELNTFMELKYTGSNPAERVPKIIVPEGL